MKRGRPRSKGERWSSGRLREGQPNARVLGARRAAAPRIEMGENPLDAAFANGWLTEREHWAGRFYARLCARAKIGGPKAARMRFDERQAPFDGRPPDLGELPRAEIAALWDLAFGDEQLPRGDAAEAEARAMAAWRKLAGVLSAAARLEVHDVCVLEIWPQWVVKRIEAVQLSRRATAERRSLSDAELAAVVARLSGETERRRLLLVEGLAAVADVAGLPKGAR